MVSREPMLLKYLVMKGKRGENGASMIKKDHWRILRVREICKEPMDKRKRFKD